jgi:hypothetical protein
VSFSFSPTCIFFVEETRVTRLVEFSPIWRLSTLGGYLKIIQFLQNFWLLF